MPDGKTVTPINDVPTWLKCAGINGSTYTTLAEVLADSSLLRVLINSENAMDYLVRCKEWIKQEALVPTMTSNTTPSGVASASSELTGQLAYNAFDRNSATEWHTVTSSGLPAWLKYQFANSVNVSTIKMKNRVHSSTSYIHAPKNFTIEGSNDDTTWETIGTFQNTNNTSGYESEYTTNSMDKYTYIRCSITSSVDNSNQCNIGELQFYPTSGICDNSTAMTYIGANDYASNLLLGDEDWLEAICNSEYMSYLLNPQVPTMTSNTLPFGTAFCSSYYSGNLPYQAFDNNENTQWGSGDSEKSPTKSYVGYQSINRYKAYCAFAIARQSGSSTHKVQASNDGITWTDLSNDFNFNSSNNWRGYIRFISNGDYSYYRLQGCNDASNSGNDIKTLQFYAHPNGGVQSWLLSAGITNKSYTTLSEVFSDTETLRTLLNNHNAVYYLTTVPGWATEFAANENAMKYIGANDYASDILLANEEWVDAIANSTYYTEILNTKVPTMTSDTTPSGEVLGDVTFQSGFEGYKAFDNNNGTWSKFSTSTTAHAIGYDFGYNVTVSKAVIRPYYSSTSAKIQTSSDNITWNDTSAAIGVTQDVDNIISSNNYAKNRYWRLYLTNSSASNFFIREIQFYGRITGGVQSWLLAAGITNKNYTTVAQVLADSDLLPVLIASHSGMDYLATCTAFASAICANEDAMELIGNDNYASDTLLSDETWLNAIYNSAYFESVLNAKVPVMTSNTTPSGEVITSSNASGFEGYKAFDENNSTSWRVNSNTLNGSYIIYHFTEQVSVHRVVNSYVTGSGSVVSNTVWELYGSNDNNTYTDIGEVQANSVDAVANLLNGNEYTYYKLQCKSPSTSSNTTYGFASLQFYGRVDV